MIEFWEDASVVQSAALEEVRAVLPLPDRDAEPVELDVSFSSHVVRFGDSVVRFARNPDVTRTHANEARILPTLAGRLPVSVATPVREVPPSKAIPFGALVQPFLRGRVALREDVDRLPWLPTEIAACLAEVHRQPLDGFEPGAVGALDPVVELERLLPAVVPYVESRLAPVELRELNALADLCRAVLPGRERVFCHVDPWFGNFLLGDDGHLVALLDFEYAANADPAVDLAAQVYLAPATRNRLLSAYLEQAGPLADVNERIRGWRLLRELDGLAYCLRNDHEELEDTVKMLRAALDE